VRVLGIDPGSRACGFGVVEEVAGTLRVLDVGCIRNSNEPLPKRLGRILHELEVVILRNAPTTMAIEKVFMARNPQSALTLGHARGAAICAGVRHDLEIAEYAATEIKKALVGKGHASKEQVQHMVKVILDYPDALGIDASDALACAVCHLHHLQGQRQLTKLGIARG